MVLKKEKIFLVLIAILIISSFFRLWKLQLIPPGLYPDEAINANEALNSLKSGNFKVFYRENNGREGLFISLVALSFLIFGVSIWALKIVPAIVGILTVLGLYLLTKEIFNREVAIFGSFFLAISFWHTNFSRIGFRGILVPFILVFALYFLFRAFKSKKLSDFFLSALFWGLGFYSYIAFRMAIFLLAIFLLLELIKYFKEKKPEKNWSWLWNKMYLRDGWWKVDFFFLIIILIALPLAIYFLQNPQDFFSRAVNVSVFSQENPPKAFLISLGKHLAMFNLWGDPNWRHNIAGSPLLFWPVGILFLVGLFYSLWKGFQKRESIFLFLLSGFFIMLLPGILTFEGIPHALRCIGAIPFVYIFVGLGTNLIFWQIKNSNVLKKIGIFALILIAAFQFHRYFFVWGEKKAVKDAFSGNYVEMGNYLNSLPANFSRYVICNAPGVPVPYPQGLPMPCQTIMFLENTKPKKKKIKYLLPKEIDQIKIKGKTIILPMRGEENLFQKLREKFPKGQILKIKDFSVYEVE